MRLSHQESLTRAFQFARVREGGTSCAGRLLLLNFLKLEDSSTASRFGIICTKKVGNAVMRNRLKRRIRDLLRTHGSQYAKGWHVVCVLRWRAAEARFDQLEKDFCKVMTRHRFTS